MQGLTEKLISAGEAYLLVCAHEGLNPIQTLEEIRSNPLVVGDRKKRNKQAKRAKSGGAFAQQETVLKCGCSHHNNSALADAKAEHRRPLESEWFLWREDNPSHPPKAVRQGGSSKRAKRSSEDPN